MPFSTDLAGDYPVVTDATVLFHANMFIVGFLFSVQWYYFCRHGHLCEPVPDEVIMHGGFYRSLVVPALAVIGGILCFFNPSLSPLVSLTLSVGASLLRRVPLL
ncbi:MAG: hypothetical protein WCB46_08180 [Methanoregula sp.]